MQPTRVRLPRGIKIHEANGLDYGLPPWLAEKQSLIDRAEKRLQDTSEVGGGVFRVAGNPRLQDDFESYEVRKVGNRWECDCEGHAHGGARRGKCSHIVACRIFEARRPWRFLEPDELREEEPVTRFLSKDELAEFYKPKFVDLPAPPKFEFITQPAAKVYFLHENDPDREFLEVDAGQGVDALEEFECGDPEDLWIELARQVLGDEVAFEEPGCEIGQSAAVVVVRVVEPEEPGGDVDSGSDSDWEPALPEFKPLAEIELPEWCPEVRSWQVYAVEKICQAFAGGKKHVLLEGPVGMGKTLTAYLVTQALGVRANYICTDKNLQAQFIGDYRAYGAEMLYGRSNYIPVDASHKTCEDCDYKKGKGCTLCLPLDENRPFTSKVRCPYQIAKKRAQESDLAVLNTKYALAAFNFRAAGTDNQKGFWGHSRGDPESCGFARRGLSIYDEAHELERSLMDFAEVVIGPKMLEFFEAIPPAKTSRWSKRIAWLKALAEKIFDFVKTVRGGEGEEVEPGSEEEEEENKFLSQCEQTAFKIAALLVDLGEMESDPEELRETWVYDRSDNSVSFKPVRVHKYGRAMLFDHSRLNLLMSGTILAPQAFAEDLGLDWDDCAFVQLDAVFPPENGPILVWPVAAMSFKEKARAIPKMREQVLKTRLEYPGRMLVHTVSYDLTGELAEFLRHNGLRPITHGSGPGLKEEALERFKAGPESGIILSPACHTGVDLPGDHCRLVGIPKIPFPSLTDDQVKRRMWQPNKLAGNRWYWREAMRKVMQMSGRGRRFFEDWCRIFVWDAQFMKLYRDMKPELLRGFIASLVFEMRASADPLTKRGLGLRTN